MDKELFDDLIASCKEVIEYQKGNIQLKTTVLEIPDEEISFYSEYRKLSDVNKIKAMAYVSGLSQSTGQQTR